jgi:hypothetical protein
MKWPNTLIIVGGALGFLGGMSTMIDGQARGLVATLAGLGLVGFGVRRARRDIPEDPESSSHQQSE